MHSLIIIVCIQNLHLPIYDEVNSWYLRVKLKDIQITPKFALSAASIIASYSGATSFLAINVDAMLTLKLVIIKSI
jgi:hypothetical protein